MSDENVLENTPENFEKLAEEANKWKAKFLYASSEAQNYKKRMDREKEKAIAFANEQFVRDLLETLDNFENMLCVDLPDEARNGTELIYQGLLASLQKNKVVECKTETFDPNFHEAVSSIKQDGVETNTVVQVLRKGYLLGDRLIRPAMVVVAE